MNMRKVVLLEGVSQWYAVQGYPGYAAGDVPLITT